MTTLYAQASAAWDNAQWNTEADGSGTPQTPVTGDECVANNYTIDCADVSLSTLTLTPGGGVFTSSKWYASLTGFWDSQVWTSRADGNDCITGVPSGTCSVYSNNYIVDASNIVVTNITLIVSGIGDTAFIISTGYAKSNGTITGITYNGRSDGTGVDKPYSAYITTLNANGFHLTGVPDDIVGRTLTITEYGSFTIGSTAATWPAAANVSDVETAYGPTGAEYHGELDLGLYTLTSGIVWPAAANVSDVETAYGPTGTEYHGDLDLDLYTLIEDIAPVTTTSVLIILPNAKISTTLKVEDCEICTLTPTEDITASIEVSNDDLTWHTISPTAYLLRANTAWPVPNYIFAYKYIRLHVPVTATHRTITASVTNALLYTG